MSKHKKSIISFFFFLRPALKTSNSPHLLIKIKMQTSTFKDALTISIHHTNIRIIFAPLKSTFETLNKIHGIYYNLT